MRDPEAWTKETSSRGTEMDTWAGEDIERSVGFITYWRCRFIELTIDFERKIRTASSRETDQCRSDGAGSI
jgi:hypothetical protein